MRISVSCKRAGGIAAGRDQSAVAHCFGGQHAEQVEVGGLFVLERADLVPGPVGRAEHLETLVGAEQAHGAVGLLLQRVRDARDGGQIGEFGEDRPGLHPLLARGPAAGRGLGAAGRAGQRGALQDAVRPGWRGLHRGGRAVPLAVAVAVDRAVPVHPGRAVAGPAAGRGRRCRSSWPAGRSRSPGAGGPVPGPVQLPGGGAPFPVQPAGGAAAVAVSRGRGCRSRSSRRAAGGPPGARGAVVQCRRRSGRRGRRCRSSCRRRRSRSPGAAGPVPWPFQFAAPLPAGGRAVRSPGAAGRCRGRSSRPGRRARP